MKRHERAAERRRQQGVFPGGIAGASLKRPSWRSGDPAPYLVFPGGIAGASLKR